MKNSANLLQWLPRIICILAILFVSLFATDAFKPGLPFLQQVTDFVIHLIPSFILLAMLLLAWKKELAGGILFTAVGIILSPFIFLHNYHVNHFSIGQCTGIIMMITFPFVAAGLLFITSHFIGKRHFQQRSTA